MVVVYSKPVGCYACKFTKKRLDALGVEYRDVDVTTDPSAYEFITNDLGYKQVPVVVGADGAHFSGFDPDRLDALAA